MKSFKLYFFIIFFVIELGFCVSSENDSVNLQSFYEITLLNSPTLKSEYANYQSQAMNETIRLSSLLPNANFQTSITRTNNWDETIVYPRLVFSQVYTASLNQPIINFQSLFAYQASRDDTLASLANYNYENQKLTREVILNYFKTLLAKKEMEVSKTNFDSTVKLLTLTTKEVNSKIKDLTDLKQIEVEYYRDEADLSIKESKLEVQYYLLSEISAINIMRIKPLRHNISILKKSYKPLAYWIDTALQNNYRLISQRYQQESKNKAIEACKSRLLPTVSLALMYGYNVNPFLPPASNGANISNSSYFDSYLSKGGDIGCYTSSSNSISPNSGGIANIPNNEKYYSGYIGITFNWSIFNGGTNYALISQASEKYEEVSYNRIQIRREVIKNIKYNFVKLKSSSRNIHSFKKAVKASRLAYNIMLKQYNKNFIPISQVLQQLEENYKNELMLNHQRYEYIVPDRIRHIFA